MNPWDEAYQRGVAPPWDIGRPQPEFRLLADSGVTAGRVIDVGCGTGENALMLAAHGLEVVGVDVAASAIARARAKAAQRGLTAEFHAWDALQLGHLIKRIGTFDCAIDSGVFHTFSDEQRPMYVAGVGAAVRVGGQLFLMCFSEHEPDWGGPRRVTQAEIRDAFSDGRGWSVEEITPARFATNHPEGGSHAWLATIRRIEPPPGLPEPVSPGEARPPARGARPTTVATRMRGCWPRGWRGRAVRRSPRASGPAFWAMSRLWRNQFGWRILCGSPDCCGDAACGRSPSRTDRACAVLFGKTWRVIVTTGTIKKVVADRGFGFIAAEDGKEYFFHRNGLQSSLDFDRLMGGERVSFEIEASPKGPRANDVRAA